MAKARGDFSEVLIKKGLLGADQLSDAKGLVSSAGMKLQDAIVKLGYLTQDQVVGSIAEFHGLEFIDLTEATISVSVVELVPESVARENVILPLSEANGALKLIMSDPSDFDTVQKLQFILNKDIIPVIAPREQIIEAINRHYGQSETESVDSMLAEFTDTAIDFTETESNSNAQAEESDAPVVKLVNLIIQEAVSLRASDIHVEPFADRIRIRYRIDGMLVERDSPPRRLLAPMLSRLKIMGSMDIAEKRRPQDGRIKLNLNGKHYDLRVSMLPTNNGQSCVMRILDRGNIQVSIKDLGFAEDDFARFQQIIKRPNGIFLVTGPTGSGKTTTLYSALNELNRPDRKIITAEDPVEYYLPGINQVEVKHNIGLDFARIIRAMLASSTQHHSGWRNSRSRNGRHRYPGVFDWTLGFQHTTYERCAQCHYTSRRYWRTAVPGSIQYHRHHGAAFGASDLPEMQGARHAFQRGVEGCRLYAGTDQKGDLHARAWLQSLQPYGLSWPHRHL